MSAKTKLAVVISNMGIGGAQKVVIDLLNAMDKTKFEIKLFVHNEHLKNHFSATLEQMQISVEYIEVVKNSILWNYINLAHALNTFDPDVVHIHLDTMFAPLWAWIHRKKALFTVHSQPNRTFNRRFLVQLHHYLMKSNRYRITAVSTTIARETEQLLQLPENSVHVIYNPVNIPEYTDRQVMDVVRFVNVARFFPVKNHKLLLRAFAKVCEKHKSVLLTIAGDGELFENCMAYARELQIEDRVSFLGDVQDIYGLLMEQDVFVLSSDSEAMPISVLEAMACSMPIVSTAVGGIPDIIQENGILVPKGDAGALCQAMLDMIEMPERRRTMGRLSYEQVQEFHAQTISAAYEELYVR